MKLDEVNQEDKLLISENDLLVCFFQWISTVIRGSDVIKPSEETLKLISLWPPTCWTWYWTNTADRAEMLHCGIFGIVCCVFFLVKGRWTSVCSGDVLDRPIKCQNFMWNDWNSSMCRDCPGLGVLTGMPHWSMWPIRIMSGNLLLWSLSFWFKHQIKTVCITLCSVLISSLHCYCPDTSLTGQSLEQQGGDV